MLNYYLVVNSKFITVLIVMIYFDIEVAEVDERDQIITVMTYYINIPDHRLANLKIRERNANNLGRILLSLI